MGPSKSSKGKASMSSDRMCKVHTPMGAMSGKGSGMTKRDSAIATSSSGGRTLKYTKGDVKRTAGSFKSYK